MRPTRLPLTVEVISSPMTIGMVRNPDSDGDTPSTNCMKVGMNVSAPSIAKPTTSDSTQHMVKTGFRNSRIGRIGSAAFSSTRTNIARARIDPTTSPMMVGEVQASSPPRLVASVRPDAPIPTQKIPA